MSGQSENVIVSENGAVIEVNRGDKGVALINISEEIQNIALETTISDGTYTDKVHNTTFNVVDGKISGELAPLTSYIIY
jgi:alpha-amylase